MEILPFFAIDTYSIGLMCTGGRGKNLNQSTGKKKLCYAEEQHGVFQVLGILSEQQKKY